MDRNELIEFLKENLTLDTSEYHGYYGEHSITVMLKLGKDQIGSATIDLPEKCRHREYDGY